VSSTSAATRAATVAVAGDSTVDWLVVVPTVVAPAALQASYHWEHRTSVRLVAAPGGASLLSKLIESAAEVIAPDGSVVVRGVEIPEIHLTNPDHDEFTRAFTIWQPYPIEPGRRELVWRMHQFLGLRPGRKRQFQPDPVDQAPDVVIIDDANLGFRDLPGSWPTCISGSSSSPRQVILKMSNPLASGPLWDVLTSRFADRLTVYCSVGDLRKEYAPIGQPLSWERTASDIVSAVRGRSDLALARRVVVTIGLSGAVIVERDGHSTLVYDPMHQEGDWERNRPGIPLGLGTCIAAALAIAATRRPDTPDWIGALRAGLTAGRDLHERRYVLANGDGSDGIEFPMTAVARSVADEADASTFRAVEVSTDPDWYIFSSAFSGNYRDIAARIVIDGVSIACRDLPIERMGAWSSIDRTEVESMRSVRNIIREYLQHTHKGRPLSLAVFGPPGSGKSFAIKQMAREWINAGTPMTVLEFNLSQFSDAADLPDALQRVRDCAVEGTLPLVFWDEFDTRFGGRELGWLAHFLAPMQDGAFIENGISRPIGPAIFIFAGGTHPTMSSFKARAVQLPGAKATDFLSRLRGFVDILGPNPIDAGEHTFVLRRALLLRALLGQKAPGLFRSNRLDIDPGVLRAFLDVTTYVHGARSMESIVDMSQLSGKLRYERSSLPPQHQLGLHVDPDEFLALVHDRDDS
jgi:hypothetical protein